MNRTHAPAPRLNSRQLTLILLLFGFSTVSYFDRIIMPAAGPRLMRDFSISPTAMGSVYSAFILGYALLMIPGGHLSDRLGARRTLALMAFGSAGFTALTVLAGSSLISAWVGTVAILWVIRFGMAIVTAPLYPACACATGDWIPLSTTLACRGSSLEDLRWARLLHQCSLLGCWAGSSGGRRSCWPL